MDDRLLAEILERLDDAGPGLTLVVGPNGTGKSSFAEELVG